MDKNFASETFRQMNTAFEPWMNAAKAWASESEKLQKLAVENMTKAMDNSHKMAKDGLELFVTMSANAQKQFSTQVERSAEMMGSILP
jgi:hypothetical protein